GRESVPPDSEQRMARRRPDRGQVGVVPIPDRRLGLCPAGGLALDRRYGEESGYNDGGPDDDEGCPPSGPGTAKATYQHRDRSILRRRSSLKSSGARMKARNGTSPRRSSSA